MVPLIFLLRTHRQPHRILLYKNSSNCHNQVIMICAIKHVFLGGFQRWFNLTLVNISADDADDYTCVGVNINIIAIIVIIKIIIIFR